MDFKDSPEEAAFRAEARAWLEANAEPLAEGETNAGIGESDDPNEVATAKAWQAKKADAGWAAITWPKEYGGRAATPIENIIWNQEESRFQVPPNIFMLGIVMGGPTVMAHGTDPQKDRWIEKLLRGEEVWCQCFSEPSAGSDLAGLRTRAERDGDDWIINGQKIWTSGAHYSKWGMLVARSDANAVKHAGLTYFIVDMEAPGVEVRPIKQITGGANFNEVFFSDVRIPDENRISGVGNGWAVAITTLMNERAGLSGGMGGGMSFSDLLDLARNTYLGDEPAIENGAVRARLADFFVRTKGLEYTRYRTVTALSRGQTPGPEGSIGKLIGSEMSQKMASFAVELQGATGGVMASADIPSEAGWQEAYLSSPGSRIAGGSDEIMRNIIAERVLGLPPEMRADKGIPFRDIPSGPKK